MPILVAPLCSAVTDLGLHTNTVLVEGGGFSSSQGSSEVSVAVLPLFLASDALSLSHETQCYSSHPVTTRPEMMKASMPRKTTGC